MSTKLSQSICWQALQSHAKTLESTHVRDLFLKYPQRFKDFSVHLDGILFDYSKNLVTHETRELLLQLAQQERLSEKIKNMFNGEQINNTEHRAALHSALRNQSARPIYVDGQDVMPEVRRVLEQMRIFCNAITSGSRTGYSGRRFTDIVNIGVGGSDLGPVTVSEALKPYAKKGLRVHYVSNIDGTHLHDTLALVNPETTLFIVSSKTFTTQETSVNAASARAWLKTNCHEEALLAQHFVAVTANPQVAQQAGYGDENIFELWDWVGGRYSVWSAIGLPVALTVGMDNFTALLSGAHAMDEHFRTAPLTENMPVLMALIAIWHINFMGVRSNVVVPYDQYLKHLPVYLQQLDMESLGKSVASTGEKLDYATGATLLGKPGTNAQHAFFQLLHQGTQRVPVDLIAACQSHNPMGNHHEILLANFFAQGEALMRGRTYKETHAELLVQRLSKEQIAELLPHKTFHGSKPCNSILCKIFDPYTIGALLALYEHKVTVQGMIWNINSFDQWGVELGKQLASNILRQLQTDAPTDSMDESTKGLINFYQVNKKP